MFVVNFSYIPVFNLDSCECKPIRLYILQVATYLKKISRQSRQALPIKLEALFWLTVDQ